jgi:RNA polymerase sigma factor (TIGR02999 family)
MNGSEVTSLLISWKNGDREAFDRLFPLVVGNLRSMARSCLAREQDGHTLQPTALVNEVYLRMVGCSKIGWKNRAHFFGACARTMRRILVDHARRKRASKRGGGVVGVSLDQDCGVADSKNVPSVDLLALDQALTRLAELDSRQCRIVELRFFAGLSTRETAEVVGLAPRTVTLEWTKARAWLFRELTRR